MLSCLLIAGIGPGVVLDCGTSIPDLCHLSYFVLTCWKSDSLLALLFVIFYCVFATFPYGVLGQVWYLIVSIPDLCFLTYLDESKFKIITVSCLGFRQSTCVSLDCIPTSQRSICKQKSVIKK